jgi:putative addiction module antidote
VIKVIALKLRKVGNSVGAILPQEILARMHVTDGDTIFLTEAPGGYRLTPYDPDFEQQMTRARRIMKKRRNVLRELAN